MDGREADPRPISRQPSCDSASVCHLLLTHELWHSGSRKWVGFRFRASQGFDHRVDQQVVVSFLFKCEGDLGIILKPDKVDDVTWYSEVDRFLQPYGANR